MYYWHFLIATFFVNSLKNCAQCLSARFRVFQLTVMKTSLYPFLRHCQSCTLVWMRKLKFKSRKLSIANTKPCACKQSFFSALLNFLFSLYLDLYEGLKNLQRGRLEDQRGTEIKFEMPEFLKRGTVRHYTSITIRNPVGWVNKV